MELPLTLMLWETYSFPLLRKPVLILLGKSQPLCLHFLSKHWFNGTLAKGCCHLCSHIDLGCGWQIFAWSEDPQHSLLWPSISVTNVFLSSFSYYRMTAWIRSFILEVIQTTLNAQEFRRQKTKRGQSNILIFLRDPYISHSYCCCLLWAAGIPHAPKPTPGVVALPDV